MVNKSRDAGRTKDTSPSGGTVVSISSANESSVKHDKDIIDQNPIDR